MADVAKVTIIDSPEKMRATKIGYSIIIPCVHAEPFVNKWSKTRNNTKGK